MFYSSFTNRKTIIHNFFHYRKFEISRVAPLFTRKHTYPMFPVGISPFSYCAGADAVHPGYYFRLSSSSRYFSDTSFLNSNENFAMRPQFSIWCLTFGAHYNSG